MTDHIGDTNKMVFTDDDIQRLKFDIKESVEVNDGWLAVDTELCQALLARLEAAYFEAMKDWSFRVTQDLTERIRAEALEEAAKLAKEFECWHEEHCDCSQNVDIARQIRALKKK